MTRLTDSNPVIYDKPQFRIPRERFNMMGNKNMPFVISALLANKMVSLKYLSPPLFHFKRISSFLVSGANSAFPTRMIRTPQGVSLCAIADIKSLFWGIPSALRSYSGLCFLRYYALRFIGKMMPFERTNTTLCAFSNHNMPTNKAFSIMTITPSRVFAKFSNGLPCFALSTTFKSRLDSAHIFFISQTRCFSSSFQNPNYCSQFLTPIVKSVHPIISSMEVICNVQR